MIFEETVEKEMKLAHPGNGKKDALLILLKTSIWLKRQH